MNVSIISFLIIAMLASSITALDLTILNIFGNFDLEAAISSVTSINSGLNIGTGILGSVFSYTGTLSSALEITGGLVLGNDAGSNPILKLAAGAELVVDSLTLNGGSIILEAGSSLLVTGAATLDAETVLSVAAGSTVIFSADVSGEGTIDATGIVEFTSDLAIDVALNLKGAAEAYIQAGETIFNGAVSVVGALTVEADASAEFNADVTLGSGSSLQVAGSAEFNADINLAADASAAANIIFSSAAEAYSTIKAASVEAALFVEGSAHLFLQASAEAVDNIVQIYGNLNVSSSGHLSIHAGSSAYVEGDASFSSESSYTIEASSEDSTYVLDVQGAVQLGGNLVIVTDLDFSTEILIMTYGSRVEGSAFAGYTIVGSSEKRDIQHHDEDHYNIEYRDNEAVLVPSSSSVVISSFLLVVLALLY